MSNIPIQYMTKKKIIACIVIDNTEENKEYAEALICKLLGIKTGSGVLTFGPACSAKEALRFNENWQEIIAKATKSTIIYAPDLLDDDGKVLIKGGKKRRKEKN